MLCIGLIIITFSAGCGRAPKPIEKQTVPQKCRVPYTQKAEIDHKPCPDKDYGCIAEKFAKNYEAQKDYGKRLEVNSRVCR